MGDDDKASTSCASSVLAAAIHAAKEGRAHIDTVHVVRQVHDASRCKQNGPLPWHVKFVSRDVSKATRFGNWLWQKLAMAHALRLKKSNDATVDVVAGAVDEGKSKNVDVDATVDAVAGAVEKGKSKNVDGDATVDAVAGAVGDGALLLLPAAPGGPPPLSARCPYHLQFGCSCRLSCTCPITLVPYNAQRLRLHAGTVYQLDTFYPLGLIFSRDHKDEPYATVEALTRWNEAQRFAAHAFT